MVTSRDERGRCPGNKTWNVYVEDKFLPREL
jgi:hypothetical protein